jgi:hypothetical protein
MDRFIPIFPNEISRLIVDELSLHDLAACYLVSAKWKRFMDDENAIREKMFRLPKHLDNASEQVHVAFVSTLWQRVYAVMDDDERSPDVYWSHIPVNPLMLSYYPRRRRDEISDTRTIECPQRYYIYNRHLLSPDEEKEITSLLDTMVATHPPVSRIQLVSPGLLYAATMIPRAPPPRLYSTFLDVKGYTLEKVVEISQEKLYYFHSHDIKLWPEKLWQLTHGTDSEDGDEEDEEQYEEDNDQDSDYEESEGTSSDEDNY